KCVYRCSRAMVTAFDDVCESVHHTYVVETHHLGDERHLAASILEPGHLNDQLHARAYLRAHGVERHFQIAHHGHGFQTGERVSRIAGMQSSHAPSVAAGHCLHDVERFTAADFSDNHSIWSHAQSGPK